MNNIGKKKKKSPSAMISQFIKLHKKKAEQSWSEEMKLNDVQLPCNVTFNT